MLHRILKKKTVVLNRLALDHSDNMAFSRFLNNPSVKLERVCDGIVEQCGQNAGGRDLLLLVDRTKFNFAHHRKRIKAGNIGPIRGNQLGFLCQAALALDYESGVPIGLAGLNFWHREPGFKTKKERKYTKQALEEKESYHWITQTMAMKKPLEKARRVTLVSDSETDLYEQLCIIQENGWDCVIRTARNRITQHQDLKLFEFLAQSPSLGEAAVEIKASPGKKRTARTAKLNYRSVAVEFTAPQGTKRKLQVAGKISLFAVEAKESPESVPSGEKPIIWRLLSSRKVSSLEQAQEVVDIYRERWHIEQLFRAMKKQGLNIAESQVESGMGLQKLTAIAFIAALQIIQLHTIRDKPKNLPAKIAFNATEIALLYRFLKKYEGKTEKQKNPFTPETLKWANWILGRMGGWKAYYSNGPPGVISIKRGLVEFYQVATAMTIVQDVYKE